MSRGQKTGSREVACHKGGDFIGGHWWPYIWWTWIEILEKPQRISENIHEWNYFNLDLSVGELKLSVGGGGNMKKEFKSSRSIGDGSSYVGK